MSDYSENAIREILQDSYDWFLNSQTYSRTVANGEHYPYDKLFSPCKINRLELKNRVVMAPMGNVNMADETGAPSERMLCYFAERAKGGVGLITSGLIPVSQNIDPTVTERNNLTYFPRLSGSRTFYAGWRNIAAAVHAYGSAFFIQLTAGLGRVGNPQCLLDKHRFPVSASFNPNYYMPQIPCFRLSDRKIRKIVKNMGQTAADAKEAGIDGVYLHGHEGYLLEQLTNGAFNRRRLGKYRDKERFGIEIVQEIRRRTSADYPIMYRIDLSLALNATYGDKMTTDKRLKKYKNERTLEQTLQYMTHLVEAGVDAFDVDLGCYDNWWLPHPPMSAKPGLFLEAAAIAKKYFAEHAVKTLRGQEVMVAAVGKLGNPDMAEMALQKSACDLVMLGRPLLADAAWAQKAKEGRISDIRPCIGCQEACINEFIRGGHLQCAVNPVTAFEFLQGRATTPLIKSKKVAVIGAGPAGFECTMQMLKQGHAVDVFDSAAKAGGMTLWGGVPKFKYEIRNYARWMHETLEKEAAVNAKLSLHFNCEATLGMLADGHYDAIICALGSKAVTLPVKGAEYAVSGVEVLKNPALLADKHSAVIIGGGDVGSEIAYMLAYEYDMRVSLVEMGPYLMPKSCTANRGHVLQALAARQVAAYNCSKVTEIKANCVNILQNQSETVPDPFDTLTPILPSNVENPLQKPIKEKMTNVVLNADIIIYATGQTPNRDLYDLLFSAKTAPEIELLGDANRVGMVKDAVRAGFLCGQNL